MRPMRIDPSDVLTVSEAAKAAGTNEQAVYRAERKGDLKRLPTQGKAYLFARADVERWAETLAR